ncbi:MULTISPECIES: helix-turn-helix domain-containing protein [unclassified Ruegeria]|uniref:helix-turn-helix domain-containing protein n=1 Tax=unclassified Ruegeria TaxID=2625375 RepID=UPI001488C4EA|nr:MULTISPECIES: helix-turn-helix domain-containing protein [unclassified Ruegeria]
MSSRRSPKGKRSDEGQFVYLPYAMIKSPAWRALSGPAVKLWLELHTRFNGGNNGKVFLSMNEAAEILGLGKATVQRAFAELQDKGFLVLEQEGNWYHRRAHEWRLTTKAMQTRSGKKAATNNWRFWQPQKTKRGSETDSSPSSVVPFENPKTSDGSISEPVRPVSLRSVGSDLEH